MKWKRKKETLGMKPKIAVANAQKLALTANGSGTKNKIAMYALLAETFNKK
jgi:hypothetical protein